MTGTSAFTGSRDDEAVRQCNGRGDPAQGCHAALLVFSRHQGAHQTTTTGRPRAEVRPYAVHQHDGARPAGQDRKLRGSGQVELDDDRLRSAEAGSGARYPWSCRF